MTWHVLTEDDVLAALNAAELETYRGQLADGQTDPLEPILSATTSEVRGYVAAATQLTGEGVPESLVNAAVDIAIYRLAKRCQMESEPQRKQAADDAYGRLDAVAAGDIAVDTDVIEEGETPVTQAGNWGSETKIGLRA